MKNYRETFMRKEIGQTPEILSDLYKDNIETVRNIAKTVRERKISNIYAVGRGTSDHALIYFKYAAEILCGMPVALGACSVVTLYDGALDLSSGLVIGCSQSGSAADVSAVLERAGRQGGVTVGVTNNPESLVASVSQFHLNCDAGKEISVAATKTFSAELYLLAMLAAELGNSEDWKQELLELPDRLAAAMPEAERAVEPMLEDLAGMKDGFLLARGLMYPVALEGSLKLQETSYVRMKGYATSDFYHGPMAMISEGTPVLLLAARDTGNGKVREDALACLAKMRELGANVWLVTDDEHLAGEFRCVRLPSFGNGASSVFLFALALQLFACRFSCSVGNDPDTPRALKKVTVTR